MKPQKPKTKLNAVADLYSKTSDVKKEKSGKKVTPQDGEPEGVEPGADVEDAIDSAAEDPTKAVVGHKHPKKSKSPIGTK
jgi:hypothetical protein